MTKQPFEQDIEWLKQKSKEKGLRPPTENSKEAFAERVAIILSDKTNSQSIDIVRDCVFSAYLWGGVGDMPEKNY